MKIVYVIYHTTGSAVASFFINVSRFIDKASRFDIIFNPLYFLLLSGRDTP